MFVRATSPESTSRSSSKTGRETPENGETGNSCFILNFRGVRYREEILVLQFLFPLQKERQHFYPFTEMLWRKLPFTSLFPAPSLMEVYDSERQAFIGLHIHYWLGGYFSLKNRKTRLTPPPFFFNLLYNSCLDLYKDRGSAYLAHYFQLISKAGKPSFISALCTSCPDSGWLCSLVLSWGTKLFSFRVM